MTGSDPIKFGKYKGTPLKDIDRGYFEWLLKQEGFTTKQPELTKWIKEGDVATSTPTERQTLIDENTLLNSMPTPFREWWMRAYGTRLRQQGETFYIGYLRVATEAWQAASKQLAVAALEPVKPVAPVPATLIQAQRNLQDNRDEEVNF